MTKHDGRWHLAGEATQENLIPGRLRLPHRGSGRLRIYGPLAGYLTEAKLVDHQRIVGVVGRRLWTLEDCFPLSYGHINDEPELWNVELALSGVALDRDEELLCDIGYVVTNHLMRFIGRSGLRMEKPDRSKPFDGTLHVSALPEESHSFNGGTVGVRHRLQVAGPGEIDQANIEQDFGIRLDFDERQRYRDAIAAIGDFQDLLSIAANRPAEYKRMSLVSNDVPMAMLNGPHKTAKEEIEVYANWTARDEKKKRELWHHDYVVQYDDLGGAAGLAAWANYSQEFRLITRRVMATRYARNMYVSDRFGNRIAALEAWDVKVSGGRRGGHLKPRLERLVRRAGPIFDEFVGDPNRWIEIINSTRNGVAHHDESILAGPSSDQYCLAESLYWLYVILALRYIDISDVTLARIAKHAAVTHWRDRTRDLMSRTPNAPITQANWT